MPTRAQVWVVVHWHQVNVAEHQLTMMYCISAQTYWQLLCWHGEQDCGHDAKTSLHCSKVSFHQSLCPQKSGSEAVYCQLLNLRVIINQIFFIFSTVVIIITITTRTILLLAITIIFIIMVLVWNQVLYKFVSHWVGLSKWLPRSFRQLVVWPVGWQSF